MKAIKKRYRVVDEFGSDMTKRVDVEIVNDRLYIIDEFSIDITSRVKLELI